MKTPTPLQEIKRQFLTEKDIQLFIKREDLNHPLIMGNKWRKLKYNLEQARVEEHTTLLTFGGAFSNHIYATAAAGKEFGFKTIGIIRGERIEPLNSTLRFAEEQGMDLHFITRTDYRKKMTTEFLAALKSKFGRFYTLPEGGSNTLAIKGCAEIVFEIEIDYTHICVPCGTGSTMSGIIVGNQDKGKVIGFAAMKGGQFLEKEIQNLLNQYDPTTQTLKNWNIETAYHFGGFAKHKPPLIQFINDFKKEHNIQLEPLYTGKMLYGIFDKIEKAIFQKEDKIIVIHTGGLQGIQGFNQRFGNVLM